MNNQFLAEHFRSIMVQLDNILKEEPTIIETPDEKDVDDLLKTDRPTGIEKSNVKNLGDLIEFLDQYSELNNWRNHDAAYDDAFYENLPLEILQNVTGLGPSDIEEIASNTDAYEGDYVISDNQLTVFGAG